MAEPGGKGKRRDRSLAGKLEIPFDTVQQPTMPEVTGDWWLPARDKHLENRLAYFEVVVASRPELRFGLQGRSSRASMV